MPLPWKPVKHPNSPARSSDSCIYQSGQNVLNYCPLHKRWVWLYYIISHFSYPCLKVIITGGQRYNLFFIFMCSRVSKSVYMGTYVRIWRAGISVICFFQLLSILFLRQCFSLGPGTAQWGRLASQCAPKIHLYLPPGLGITCALHCGWLFTWALVINPMPQICSACIIEENSPGSASFYLLQSHFPPSPIPDVGARDTCPRPCPNEHYAWTKSGRACCGA